MRRYDESTFVFISTNSEHEPGGVEERWLDVMAELARKGATVRFLCLMHSPLEVRARQIPGVGVDPYILDKWNVIRARSRLRKYLKRYQPIVAHSTGLEADLLLRWAARKVPGTEVTHTLAETSQATRRRRPIESLMRRLDEVGMRNVGATFVEAEWLRDELTALGIDASRIVLDPKLDGAGSRETVARHLEVYKEFMRRA